MQKFKALDELNKLRNFVSCKTISLLRVQQADMCIASDLLTASRAEAECLCIREVCSCIQRDIFLFSFLNNDEDEEENAANSCLNVAARSR